MPSANVPSAASRSWLPRAQSRYSTGLRRPFDIARADYRVPQSAAESAPVPPQEMNSSGRSRDAGAPACRSVHHNLGWLGVADGAVRPILELSKSRHEIGHDWPHFLPDGKHFLYLDGARTPVGVAFMPGGSRWLTHIRRYNCKHFVNSP